MRWILVSLAILTACTASTLGILSMGDLIEWGRGPTPAEPARQDDG